MKKVLVVLLTIVMLFCTSVVNVFADSTLPEIAEENKISVFGDYNVSLTDGTFEPMTLIEENLYQYKGLENITGGKTGDLDNWTNMLYIRNKLAGIVAINAVVTDYGISYEMNKNALIFSDKDDSYKGTYDLYFDASTSTLFISHPASLITLPEVEHITAWNVYYNNADGTTTTVPAVNGYEYILKIGGSVTIEAVPEEHYAASGKYTFTHDGSAIDSSKLPSVKPCYGVELLTDPVSYEEGTLNEDGTWSVELKLDEADKFVIYNFGLGQIEDMELDAEAKNTEKVTSDPSYFEVQKMGTYTLTIDSETGLVYVAFVHVHTWNVEADNESGTFTATCVGEGCSDPVAQYTVTLTVPEGAVYTGESFEASFADEENWTNYVGELPAIEYYSVNADLEGAYEPLGTGVVPTHAGTYAAVATYNQESGSVSITKEYTIEKAEPTVPKAVASFSYDGTSHQLIAELSNSDAVFYALEDTESAYVEGSVALTTFVASEIGTYNIYYFGAESLDYKALEAGQLTVEITPIYLTVKWSNLSFVYDGEAHQPTCEIVGLLPQDKKYFDVTVTTTDYENEEECTAIEQGIYYATANITMSKNIEKDWKWHGKDISWFEELWERYFGTSSSTSVTDKIVTPPADPKVSEVALLTTSNSELETEEVLLTSSNPVLGTNTLQTTGSTSLSHSSGTHSHVRSDYEWAECAYAWFEETCPFCGGQDSWLDEYCPWCGVITPWFTDAISWLGDFYSYYGGDFFRIFSHIHGHSSGHGHGHNHNHHHHDPVDPDDPDDPDDPSDLPDYYVINAQRTLFYIFDHKLANERITSGTMNLTSNDGIVGILIKDITLEDFTEKIVKPAKETDPDYEAKQALLAALEDNKNIHIFAKFIDIEEEAKKMFEEEYNLTDKNAILFDVGLFASIDGDDTLYQLYDTCDYEVELTLVLSDEEASKILGTNKVYYMLRSCNGVVEEIAVSAPVMNIDENGNVTYSFTFKTSKFGSFALTSRDKGTSPDTGEKNSPLIPVYIALLALLVGMGGSLRIKEEK